MLADEAAAMRYCSNCKKDGRCTRCVKRIPTAHFPPFDDVDEKPEKTSTFSDNLQIKMKREW
jgi:hypothetical protein